MIGFSGLFNTVRDYTLQFTVTHTHTPVFTVTSLLAVVWYRLPKAEVPLPLVSRTVPGLSYHLLKATAHNNRAPSVL
jgi:hypothetical protein